MYKGNIPCGDRNALNGHRDYRRRYCLKRYVVYVALVSVCVWVGMDPTKAHSDVPPTSDVMAGADRFSSPELNRSWSAFRSDDAKNVCVTVENHGASEVFVHLFRNRSLAGAFTVLPQRISAMCSDVTVIQLECGDGSCLPRWYISDSK